MPQLSDYGFSSNEAINHVNKKSTVNGRTYFVGMVSRHDAPHQIGHEKQYYGVVVDIIEQDGRFFHVWETPKPKETPGGLEL